MLHETKVKYFSINLKLKDVDISVYEWKLTLILTTTMYLHRIAESSINLNMYVEIYSPLNQYLLTTLDHHVSIKYKDWLKHN